MLTGRAERWLLVLGDVSWSAGSLQCAWSTPEGWSPSDSSVRGEAAPAPEEHAPALPVDPRTLPVDTDARVIPVGSHLYPDRHKQVRYEAFMLGIKPWEVLEAALAEYFERRYGEPGGQ